MDAASPQIIADNYRRVQDRVAEAAQAAGRDADEVKIVAVSKYVGIEETAALFNAGAKLLGESRPQQLWEKHDAHELQNAEWHLIGHLQRNKAARTAACADLIHSVDSARLLKVINKAASQSGNTSRVLLEVNTSGDAEKHGLTAEQTRELVGSLVNYPHVEVQGLMTMAAREGGVDVARKNFAALRELRGKLFAEFRRVKLPELSMGMTGDFETAIAEGATLVRIGSALFEGL
ncbi:MAG: YggS family pyridoxal phosphate-dependent enzyme [Lacipirellulaceae bacterium]